METPIIWKNDVVFQYIFVLLAEKKKKVYPVFISGVFICILIMGNMYVVMSKLKDRISFDNKHMMKYI